MKTSSDIREITIGTHSAPGIVRIPPSAAGLVIFAHGSGSSRFSPRNTHVAEQLEARGFGTLLFDLLTEPEARNRRNVFDIPLLARRVIDAIQWARSQPRLQGLAIGLFGASTGAAAALLAAANAPRDVAAIVSRGGRPDLAAEHLPMIEAPTLLIVGGKDRDVLQLNRWAESQMRCKVSLHIVPGATHLFEELGALEVVVAEATAWFDRHLRTEGRDR